MAMQPLISDTYRALQSRLHAENANYGVASQTYAPMVAQIIRANAIKSLLDYGAGKGRLGMALKDLLPEPVRLSHYDPAIPEWSAPPQPSDMVTCIDVLEHIEPDCLDQVLDDLRRVTQRIGVFTVHTGPAAKILADGRNAHLIQQPPRWWLPKLLQRFDLIAFNRVENGFWVIVESTP